MIDGRAIYRVGFEIAEPTPVGLGVHPAVVYLNLPLNDDEKGRLRQTSGERQRVQPGSGLAKPKEGKNSRAKKEPEPEEFQEAGSDRPAPPRV